MQYKILIADDDAELVKMLKSYFELKGYEVLTAADGAEVLGRMQREPDIILLDINMPRMDGLEVCRTIRDKVSCPILFLTAKVEEQDRVNGLMMGGDDYILKPFSLRELEARITAHLKREERSRSRSEYRFCRELCIDYSARSIQVKGHTLELTPMEYEIAEFLSMNPG